QRLQHLRGAAVLHEPDHSRVRGYRPGQQRQDTLLKQQGVPGEGERALPLQDDIIVSERLAAVLPGRDAPAQLVLISRQVERHIVLWAALRSEERRVGKECRSRWWPYP